MNLQELRRQMPDIFERVKRDVDNEIGRHRAGLSLGLVTNDYFLAMGIPRGVLVGGMFISGGTMILMNVDPLHTILDEHPNEVALGYVYHILLHEYIHSLGFFNERQCRQIVLEISKNIFKDNPNHPAVVLAVKGIGPSFLTCI